MKRKIEELKKENASIKILLYMIIHDLKHPTDSLIVNLETCIQQLGEIQNELN